MPFLISTFQLSYFRDIRGVPNLYQEALRRLDSNQHRNFCTQSEYFTISNCFFFKFQHSRSSSFRYSRASQIYVRGPCTPPSGIFFVPEVSTLLCLMAFLISTFQLFYCPIYQGGAQIYTRGLYVPWTTPCGEIFAPKASTSQYIIASLISTYQLQQFPRFHWVPNLRQNALCPRVRPLAEFFLYPR